MAIEILRRHRREQARIRLALGPGYEDHDLVCPRLDGRPLSPRAFTHEFTYFISRSGLPRVTFHGLRHSHATLSLQENVHPKVVSERLGRSRVGVTLDSYSHVLPGLQTEAAGKVDAPFRGALDQLGEQAANRAETASFLT